MNLYSINKSKLVGSHSVSEEPHIPTNPIWEINGILSEYGRDPMTEEQLTKFFDMKVGSSTVLALVGERGLCTESVRITRLPDFKQNAVLFDNFAKEYVKVTNGTCTLDHSSTEGFAATHEKGSGGCRYAASEAIALRVFIEDGTAKVAWTYRAVKHVNLSAVDEKRAASIEEQFSTALSGDHRNKSFIGRI